MAWEEFRATLERKSRTGRKPTDAAVMFNMPVLSTQYNLTNGQTEYEVRDQLSFMRLLGLGLEDRIFDAKTIWLYRGRLAQAVVV